MRSDVKGLSKNDRKTYEKKLFKIYFKSGMCEFMFNCVSSNWHKKPHMFRIVDISIYNTHSPWNCHFPERYLTRVHCRNCSSYSVLYVSSIYLWQDLFYFLYEIGIKFCILFLYVKVCKFWTHYQEKYFSLVYSDFFSSSIPPTSKSSYFVWIQ